MPLLSLPNETLHTIAGCLLTTSPLLEPTSLLEFNPSLQSISIVNRRLRDICLPLAYKSVTVNFSRAHVKTECAKLTGAQSLLSDRRVCQLIKCVTFGIIYGLFTD